jgi:hypothetical protein
MTLHVHHVHVYVHHVMVMFMVNHVHGHSIL